MNDKLYIIGNGFDLHHGLRTSYSDFRDNYAKSKSRLWNTLLSIYADRVDHDLWWSRFEEMLGKIDYKTLLNSHNGMALGPFKMKQFLRNDLPFYFGEWIQSIDCLVEQDRTLAIDSKAQFFSFNYTLLLEKTYGIADEQICHIHGSITDIKTGKPVVVGHDTTDGWLVRYLNDYRQKHPDTRIDLADCINREVADGGKKVKNRLILLNDLFLIRFSTIKHYISMGFSFNEIDMPYIEKLIDVNNSFSDADWLLYSHNEEDYRHFLRTMQRLGVDMNKVNIKKW